MSKPGDAARRQAHDLAKGLAAALPETLIGVYIHGSLAMGTFNPALSDLDLIAVARRRTSEDEKRSIIEVLAASEVPAPIEFHLLAEGDLAPWRHPAPYDFHYSANWKDALRGDLTGALKRQGDADPDLAAHITITRRHGLSAHGLPPLAVFPEVPWGDYADALLRDLRWVVDSDRQQPLYQVLSPARVWATLTTKEIHSKDSGGAWALGRAEREFRPLLEGALAHYRGETESFDADHSALMRFAAFVEAELAKTLTR